MHFGTNEIFQGTFKRTTLEKVLKHAKLEPVRVQAIMMAIADVPQDPDEVSIIHIIQTLARQTATLETRKAFSIVRDSDRVIIGLGLAPTREDAAKENFNWAKHTLEEISFSAFNTYRQSLDFPGWVTFGL